MEEEVKNAQELIVRLRSEVDGLQKQIEQEKSTLRQLVQGKNNELDGICNEIIGTVSGMLSSNPDVQLSTQISNDISMKNAVNELLKTNRNLETKTTYV